MLNQVCFYDCIVAIIIFDQVQFFSPTLLLTSWIKSTFQLLLLPYIKSKSVFFSTLLLIIESSPIFKFVLLPCIESSALFFCVPQVRGFSIEYLSKVPEVKDTVHKHSILHHLCTMILEQFPESTDLYSDIGPLTRCSRVNFSHNIHQCYSHKYPYNFCCPIKRTL